MAKKSKSEKTIETTHYRHDEAKRKNIPSAAMEAEGKVPAAKRVKYAYSPHLDPILRFDPEGRADKVAAIVEKACRGEKLNSAEQAILQAVGKNWEQPWIEWAGKQEEQARGHLSVDPVALHIHERISAQAILRNAMREDAQRSLFGDPEQTYAEALQFYKHDIDWANRLILGDSLQVMSSLAHRENLAGKVQMIFMDPPYGIKFASNFQVEVARKEVKEVETDLTREPEMVRAFRDTWHLGTHSYLSYLRGRLSVAKDLLRDSGSIFVQISDTNVHRVRELMDEIFGSKNFVAEIVFTKTRPLGATGLPGIFDILLWYSKKKADLKFRPLFEMKTAAENPNYSLIEEEDGSRRRLSTEERLGDIGRSLESRVFQSEKLASSGFTATCFYDIDFQGRVYASKRTSWRTNKEGMDRLVKAERIHAAGENIGYVSFLAANPTQALANLWADTRGEMDSQYVVQTSTRVVERCMLMSTDPGDLVLDPTCGSGTTAFVSEQWGRRWITVDTSRVSLSIARQRLVTAQFEHYRTQAGPQGVTSHENPGSGFVYRTVPHVTLGSIAQNQNLDPIFEKHSKTLDGLLKNANHALAHTNTSLRERLAAKLEAKSKAQGKRSVTDADRRRWILPESETAKNGGVWDHWEVPFDIDPDWPKDLQEAVTDYRAAWRLKRDEINKCIADNAEQEQLVDQPEVARNVVRVSGPFTVEGVIPEEMSLGEDGAFDPTPTEEDGDVRTEAQNLSSYLARMVGHLRSDGLTFLNNQRKHFGRLDSAFEEGSGSFLHAEGSWDDDENSMVGVTFGPQYGPVTALQVEEAIRAAKRCTDLVIAGFSFDAETYAIVEAQQHPKLRIHIAQIRPDLNESMDGLLKNTPNSQLFSVFGQPDITVKHTKDGWICELEGVVIYNPADNTIRSANADKVAAWFLDSDYDGRCFCATQAFFPDRDAWEKIAKALGSQADADAFEAFNGTKSLPFEKGKHGRIAVKVIDPRGNEVMAIRRLQ